MCALNKQQTFKEFYFLLYPHLQVNNKKWENRDEVILFHHVKASFDSHEFHFYGCYP
jgi:hypothetical protein